VKWGRLHPRKLDDGADGYEIDLEISALVLDAWKLVGD
jgi:hypothetical protein